MSQSRVAQTRSADPFWHPSSNGHSHKVSNHWSLRLGLLAVGLTKSGPCSVPEGGGFTTRIAITPLHTQCERMTTLHYCVGSHKAGTRKHAALISWAHPCLRGLAALSPCSAHHCDGFSHRGSSQLPPYLAVEWAATPTWPWKHILRRSIQHRWHQALGLMAAMQDACRACDSAYLKSRHCFEMQA